VNQIDPRATPRVPLADLLSRYETPEALAALRQPDLVAGLLSFPFRFPILLDLAVALMM
jgi:hypothetical protein